MFVKKTIFLVLFLIPFVAFGQEEINPVDIHGDEINYLQGKGKIIARGNVSVRYKDIQLFCDQIEYDAKAHTAHIKGNVKIIKEDTVVFGREAFYNFAEHDAEMFNVRMESPPLYGRAEELEKDGVPEEEVTPTKKEKYFLKEGYVTTCDLKEPHYRLATKNITVYPRQRVMAKNVVLFVGKVPLFYFPYYSHSLKDKSFPIQIVPGKKSEYGYYVLGSWRYNLQQNQRGKWLFDWYEERGMASGLTHKIDDQGIGDMLLNLYYIEDELYTLDKRDELFDRFPERRNVPFKRLEDDRYKAQFSYTWQPTPTLSVRSEYHKFSDENFMKDFFEEEYEIEPHPLSYILVDASLNNAAVTLLAQKRMNRFFTETEYLPQLEYNLFPQNISQSSFFITSRTTAGSLTNKRAYSDLDDDAVRVHSRNKISYPKKIKWLSVNPFVGMFSTFYSKNTFGDEEIFRVAPDFGVDLNTKLFRIFETKTDLFGQDIDALRHIVTPQLSYHYVRPPTTSKDHIFQFDSIDDLEREEVITFTLNNKVQAKENGRIWDFIFFSPSIDYRINQEGKGSFWESIRSDIEVYPMQGVAVTGDTHYDIVDRAFKEANIDFTLRDPQEDKYSFSFGHRYSRGESSQSTMGFSYRISPRLQFRNYMRYEYKTGDFDEQQYILRTDLHCWWMDFGVDIDRQREGVTDYTFWIIFRLKAFPDIHVGLDHTYHGAKSEY